MHLQINKFTIVPILLAIGLLVASFVKVAVDGTWEKHLEELIVVVLGFVTFLFTDTVVELMERDRPHEEWFQEPNTWVKVTAGLSLLAATLLIFGVV
jgi:purine-cytosine permease-like protein